MSGLQNSPNSSFKSLSTAPPEPAASVNLAGEAIKRPEGGEPIQVDRGSLKFALDVLNPGPFRAVVFEKFHSLADGIPRITAGREGRAMARLEGLSSAQHKDIVDRFFANTEDNPFRAPIAEYLEVVAANPFQQAGDEGRYARYLRSLLADGLLPPQEVEEILRTSLLTLESEADGSTVGLMRWLWPSVVASSWACAPTPVAATLTSLFIGACVLARRNTLLAHDVARGYMMESLDTFTTIRVGELPDLGSTLNQLFANPDNASDFNKHWATTGFLFARILRVFGHAPGEVFSLFRSNATINSNLNPIVQTARNHLQDIGAPIPPTILLPFMDDEVSGETYKMTRDLINNLHDSYFICAIAQKEQNRRECAKLVEGMAS